MNVEIIKSLLDVNTEDHKITSDNLEVLSDKYKIGFCLITKPYTKLLKHDISIHLPNRNEDLNVILLYQYEGVLIHIKKKKISMILMTLMISMKIMIFLN